MIRNFQSAPSAWGAAHEGKGQVKNALLYGDADFSTNLRFVIYTELPPGTSIGYHTHGNDEEVYVILEGLGTMTIDGEAHEVDDRATSSSPFLLVSAPVNAPRM